MLAIWKKKIITEEQLSYCLCQISQDFFECGIHQHIRNIRIEKAKSLLIKNPDISLDDVASECGFSDYNYFIQIFRKIVGTTPKKYAAKNKGLNNTSNFILSDSVQWFRIKF